MRVLPQVPHIGDYWLHKVIDDVVLLGSEKVPGMRGIYYRRPVNERIESIGLYSYRGRELFAAWGFLDDFICAFHAVRRDEGGWYPTQRGTPAIDLVREQDRVVGMHIWTPDGIRTFDFSRTGGRWASSVA